ncbi:MATE family efflux transporter [Pyrococcus yayanosii]|uniref:Multi antimicrobial extrusion protein MatE (MatE) n=1 Tax=Pyrococcus yayanosii (strain CH1 / JCM 16557) TaxID=529709 RepID=F8AHD5_PYRYC|nr:MATE family efflux transporter [Pyrococcus yayanosii]AEH24132.1 Multi antimicrobial extrusion protein MatE (matE) [Pyrococcus yayanosii CH1]
MKSDKIRRMREEIVSGPIERTLLKLAYPLIASNLVQVLYNMADTFWLGKLGREALAAPGTTWPVIGTLMHFGTGFAMAGFAFVGQYVGAEKYERANRAAGALYSLMLIFSMMTAIISLLVLPYALSFMRVTPNVLPYAKTYATIIFIGVPFSFTFMAFNALMRATGDTKTPVKISMFTVFLNIILDPIFIFSLGMGVAGAALATVFSNAVGAVIGAYLMMTGRVGLRITRENMRPDWSFYGRIFRVGLPSSIGDSANSFGFVVLTRIIYGFGDVTYAAYVITTRLVNFITSIARGISMAMGAMVAQNVGAERYERAKKIAERTMLINFGIASFAVLTIGFFRVPIFKVFLDDPAVIAESEIVLKYFLISVPFFNGIFVVVRRVFSSAGHTKKSMLLGILRLWGLRIPLSYAFGYIPAVTILGFTMPLGELFGMTSRGVFFGMGMSNFLAALVGLAWFLRGSWMKRIIEED